jgi:hypothetical protein
VHVGERIVLAGRAAVVLDAGADRQ